MLSFSLLSVPSPFPVNEATKRQTIPVTTIICSDNITTTAADKTYSLINIIGFLLMEFLHKKKIIASLAKL